jgi:Mycotoxin biosynthesis protein UstYa
VFLSSFGQLAKHNTMETRHQSRQPLLNEHEADHELSEKTRPFPNRWTYVSRSIFSLSLVLNITFALILSGSNRPEASSIASKYASLRRTIAEPYVQQTAYTSANDTLQSQLWQSINIDAGVVALSDAWAAQHGLRSAQRFPWDASKGIYLLHGFHNLHCLKIIHISLSEYRAAAGSSTPQSRPWHHVSHCLDALRRQILCDADDTPRATERRAELVTGVGQHRLCRDWGALEAWARRHTACYKRPEGGGVRKDGEKVIERFKHCPEGSGYVVDDEYVPVDELVVGLPEESIDHHVLGY